MEYGAAFKRKNSCVIPYSHYISRGRLSYTVLSTKDGEKGGTLKADSFGYKLHAEDKELISEIYDEASVPRKDRAQQTEELRFKKLVEDEGVLLIRYNEGMKTYYFFEAIY